MENEEKFSVDTENLKEETKETVSQVKESIKNVNFKNDAEETKGFLKDMLSNPFETVRKVATGEENIFNKVIMIMLVFIAASFAYELVSVLKYGKFSGILDNIMSLVVSAINPIIYILVPTIIIFILNKENKKSIITIFSTLLVAGVPVVINELINVVENIVIGVKVLGKITLLTGPISTGLSALAVVLTYFGMKDLFGTEEHKDFIKKYAVIKVVAALVLVVLAEFGIY